MRTSKKVYLWVANLLFWGFFGISVVILFCVAVLIFTLTRPFDRNLKFLQQYSCLWASLYLWLNPFWSLKKSGLEQADRHKAYVIVSNHQSMIDILVLFNTFLHFKWVSKASLFKVPFLGWNMKINGYVPIERGDAESRDRCLKTCHDWLEKGSSVLFFPEGTRSRDGNLLPFKPGAFQLAVDSGYDVLPILIDGSTHALPKHSIFLTRKARMRLKVLPPISVQSFQKLGSLQGGKDLMGYVYQRFLDEKS